MENLTQNNNIEVPQNNNKMIRFLNVFKWITLLFVIMSFGAPLMWGKEWPWTWISPIISTVFLVLSWFLLKKDKLKFSMTLMLISFFMSAFAGLGIIMIFIAIMMIWPIIFSLGGGGH